MLVRSKFKIQIDCNQLYSSQISQYTLSRLRRRIAKMHSLRFVIAIFVSAVCLQNVASEEPYDPDANLQQHIESCLTQNKLEVTILGLNTSKDLDKLQESHFSNLNNLPEDKRGCFVACLFQKRQMIDSNGRLVLPVSPADPKKKFKTNFEDAIKPCIEEKDFCKLGECLYNVYFL